MMTLPVTGWRSEEGWVISPRGYADFGQEDGWYSIALTDLAPAQAEIERLNAIIEAAAGDIRRRDERLEVAEAALAHLKAGVIK